MAGRTVFSTNGGLAVWLEWRAPAQQLQGPESILKISKQRYKWCLRKVGIHIQKKRSCTRMLQTKLNWKYVKDLNIKFKTIKVRKKVSLYQVWKWIHRYDTKGTGNSIKKRLVGFQQNKLFCIKEHNQESERTYRMRKIFVIDISDKRMIARV
jgi:hypothetical protein